MGNFGWVGKKWLWARSARGGKFNNQKRPNNPAGRPKMPTQVTKFGDPSDHSNCQLGRAGPQNDQFG